MKWWMEIVGRVYGDDLNRPSLAPSVVHCAEGGGGVAIAVIRFIAKEPAKQIAVVSLRSGVNREDSLSHCGGLLTSAPLLWSFLEESLRSKGLNMRLLPVWLPAILVAVLLAWERAESILDKSEQVELESAAA
jgi:N-acetylglucosamine kinase-like BadF-type ATPase